MASLAETLNLLRQERKQGQSRVERLDEVMRVIESLGGRLGVRGAPRAGRTKRVLSLAGRKRIAQAQKAQKAGWAKWRAKQRKKAA